MNEVAPCALPYGLMWPSIAAALPGLDVGSIDRCRAYRSFEKQGEFQGSDSSCILTLEYPTADGLLATRTVFVKEPTAGLPEAAHYALLQASGVPTPDLLAAVDVDGREVIVTEFLPTIGVDVRSSEEIAAMLDALARLNAVPLVAERDEPPPGRTKSEMDRLRRDGLAVLATDPRSRVDVDRWFDAFDRLRNAAPPAPQALTHGQFSFQQCGWADRPGGRELVIFDFETLGARERFADVGTVLLVAADALGVPEVELLEMYLVKLDALTGMTSDPVSAITEVVTYRALDRVSALYWLTHDVYEPGSDELLLVARRLRDDLSAVGFAPDI